MGSVPFPLILSQKILFMASYSQICGGLKCLLRTSILLFRFPTGTASGNLYYGIKIKIFDFLRFRKMAIVKSFEHISKIKIALRFNLTVI